MPNQPKTPARSVRLTDDLWAQLVKVAAAHNLNVSEAIRLALIDFIKRHS